MGGYTRTGRAQRRGAKDAEGQVIGYYMVNVNPGNKIFTMKVDEEFYDQLKQLIDEWEGTWSYAAVVRQLVAEATGRVVMEELKAPSQVALKARMPAKTIEQEVKMTKPKKEEPFKRPRVDLTSLPQEQQERLAKVLPGQREMVERGEIPLENLELAFKGWKV